MARTAQTLSHEEQLAAVINALRQPAPVESPIKSFFADRAVDTVAGSGVFIGRMKAAIESAGDTYNDGYQLERERQLKLRAERILKAQQH
jgi:hypothetical protein